MLEIIHCQNTVTDVLFRLQLCEIKDVNMVFGGKKKGGDKDEIKASQFFSDHFTFRHPVGHYRRTWKKACID